MNDNSKIKAAAVVGPTASGKTALAVEIALRHSGEVVSCDSMQIYRDAPIATAVPDESEMRGVPHHLISFLSLDDEFSVAQYVPLANAAAAEIASRNRLPVITGGTGLYFSSFADNIAFTPEKADLKLRENLRNRAKDEGAQALYNELLRVDPQAAQAIHPNDILRVIRALEVYITTGKTISEQKKLSRKTPSPFDIAAIGITFRNRDVLYERINRRFDLMLEKGLISEVRGVYEKFGGTRLNAIGVKEFVPYFKGEITLDAAVDAAKMESRRYAKRQLTWFRHDERINWLYADDYYPFVENGRQNIVEDAEKILEKYGIM